MASAGAVIGEQTAVKTVEGRPIATARFEWAMVVLLTWLMTGAYTDAWYHRHNVGFESIFTPWHAMLFTGMLMITGFLGVNLVRNSRDGYPILRALPAGYGVALVGCVIFGTVMPIDLIGHLLFGIEFSLAALLSPTHLALMLAAALIVTGPLRSAWSRVGVDPGYPAILSATFLLLMFTFFSQFDQPFLNDWAAGRAAPARLPVDLVEQLGLLGILLYTASFTGLVLVLLRRFRLPFGAMTIMLGLNGLALAPLQDHYWMLAVGLVGGAAADLLQAYLGPAADRVVRLRIFAVALPAVFATLYFLIVWIAAGVWFPGRIWSGTIFAAGITGLLLSYLLTVPGPETTTR